KSDLHRWAMVGAQQRLVEIAKEQKACFATWEATPSNSLSSGPSSSGLLIIIVPLPLRSAVLHLAHALFVVSLALERPASRGRFSTKNMEKLIRHFRWDIEPSRNISGLRHLERQHGVLRNLQLNRFRRPPGIPSPVLQLCTWGPSFLLTVCGRRIGIAKTLC